MSKKNKKSKSYNVKMQVNTTTTKELMPTLTEI